MRPASESLEAARFAETHWSTVAAAARSKVPGAAAALEQLCRDYWYPLYAFLRRCGHDREDAADLTQGFFAERVITRRVLQGISRERGLFRSWLLASLKNHVAHQREKAGALKRGGSIRHLTLETADFAVAEERYLVEPAHHLTPDRLFEHAWAWTLLEQARDELKAAHERAGRGAQFGALAEFLPGAAGGRPHAEVAARLGRSENAVKMAISRLRREFGRTLRAGIARTVGTDAEVEEELRHLMNLFAEMRV